MGKPRSPPDARLHVTKVFVTIKLKEIKIQEGFEIYDDHKQDGQNNMWNLRTCL
jgi:hypothetical protein